MWTSNSLLLVATNILPRACTCSLYVLCMCALIQFWLHKHHGNESLCKEYFCTCPRNRLCGNLSGPVPKSRISGPQGVHSLHLAPTLSDYLPERLPCPQSHQQQTFSNPWLSRCPILVNLLSVKWDLTVMWKCFTYYRLSISSYVS